LKFLTTVSKYQFEKNRPVEAANDYYLTSWFIVYLAKEILLRASDSNKTVLNTDKLKELSRHFAVADVGYLDSTSARDKSELLRRQILLHYERRLWVEPVKTVMARLYYTLYQPPLPGYERYRIGWAEEFKQLIGTEFPAFFQASIGIFTSLFRSGYFDRNFLIGVTDESLKEWFTEQNVDSVLNHYSCSVAQFRTGQRAVLANSPIQSLFEFNYLRRKPLITNDDGETIAPSPILIADRLSTGVHYDLIEKLNRENRDFREFTTAYGKLFEGYVGRLLTEFYDLGSTLLAADDYCSNKEANRGICDWIVIEDDAIVLIECKASKVPLALQITPNSISFRNFLIERYVNGGRTQFEFLYEHFSTQPKEVYTLIVYNDYLSFYNDFDMTFFDSKSVIDNLMRYHTAFASIYDFEKTLPLLRQVSLGTILRKKWSDESLRAQDLSFTAEKYDGFSMTAELQCVSQVWQDVFGVS
jgi:hypothetical protein